jgi:hypothetical protein
MDEDGSSLQHYSLKETIVPFFNLNFSSSSGIAKHDLLRMQFAVTACKVI